MNAMKKLATIPSLVALAVALAFGSSPALAVPVVGADLATFAVLGATSVTSAPASLSTIVGNVGVAPGTSITGFGSPVAGANADTTGQVTGGTNSDGTPSLTPIHLNDALAISAHAQLLTAIGALSGLAVTTDLTASASLGTGPNSILTKGVYKFGAVTLSGTLTLDGNNDANAFWVFQVASLLTVAALSDVVFLDVVGNKAPVFWQVGDATLAAGADFIGNIASSGQVTLALGADIECGSAWAYTADVTLIGNNITTGCNNLGFTQVNGPGGGDDIPVVLNPVPEPEVYAMLGMGLGLMGWVARRRKQKAA